MLAQQCHNLTFFILPHLKISVNRGSGFKFAKKYLSYGKKYNIITIGYK